MIISLDSVGKSFGVNLILENITAKVEDNDRIGLIGVNGAGKSTLLNLIHGDLEQDTGEIARGSGKQQGFLRQNSGLSNQNTIQQEMDSVFAHLHQMEADMRELEQKIAAISPDGGLYKELAADYAELQNRFETADGYLIQVRISTVLNGMGFGDVDRQTPINVLSGGEKTRLALCKLLLETPDLLILDEPTNHLDFKTLLWLEDYLAGYRGALLIVSHDRYFLDRLCTSIWEVQNHNLSQYNGNYSQYVLLKEEREVRQRKEYEAQQAEIAEMKDFIARNIVRASTTARAQSRQKALDRMEKVEAPKLPPKPPFIRFRYSREPVKDVLHVEGMALSVGEREERKQLFDRLDFDMLRGEKIALIGQNGVGKSSFLKSLIGQLPQDTGYIEWGRNTDISYFDQGEGGLDVSKTAINQLWDEFPRENENGIRTVLGRAAIRGEDVYKRVGQLSGGERARLKFARLMLSCGNVLIMDEPTNHLDLATKEVLDAALQEYTGTLLVVSHDRYLLNKFPTKIAEMYPDGMHLYKGRYDQYMAQKQLESASAQPRKPEAEEEKSEKEKASSGYRTKKQRSEDAARKQRISALENRIEELETEIWELEQLITEPEIASDYVLLREKCDLLEERRTDLECALGEWSRLDENESE
ncbi:MAG: ribosomal protection-like ABC-F family protein [Oscillospiraceae bacterium]